ncbi:MAG TPA: hypothetical protein VMX58_08240 [Patescibacteria group bacterium]|nr:hypothetical protein [Patescibacteria group bacterium]
MNFALKPPYTLSESPSWYSLPRTASIENCTIPGTPHPTSSNRIHPCDSGCAVEISFGVSRTKMSTPDGSFQT